MSTEDLVITMEDKTIEYQEEISLMFKKDLLHDK